MTDEMCLCGLTDCTRAVCVASPRADTIAATHGYLVHPDGSACEDGCDRAADPVRLERYRRAPVEPPTILLLENKHGFRRYKLEGGTLADEWAKSLHPGRSAWCVITVRDFNTFVASYGGEVWPMAWPALFKPVSPSVAGGTAGVELTMDGLRALARACDGDHIDPRLDGACTVHP